MPIERRISLGSESKPARFLRVCDTVVVDVIEVSMPGLVSPFDSSYWN